MLTDSQRDIIKATVPLLEAGGEALTTHFYQGMFTAYPEVKTLFNQAHQAAGTQPRALANSVLMYAKNIDKLENLGPLAGQIVNKHVALQIQPEHYPIVGECLLRAMREVLGAEVATDEVLAAWGAAYQQLADILIGAEAAVYEQLAAAPGGWRGERAFKVERKVAESAEITSFYLAPVDGGPVLSYQPGQYIGLRLQVNGNDIRRNYSLSAAPNGKGLRISVKREANGVASVHLHDAVREGDVLQVFPPAGDFTLSEGSGPVAFVSGGVGITPTLAMAEVALKAGRAVTFIHHARNAQVHAFGEQLAQWRSQFPQLKTHLVYDVDPGQSGPRPDAVGLSNQAQLAQWLPEGGLQEMDVYVLGPKPFMASVKRSLRALGLPDARSHHEFFGPAEALA